MTGLSGRVIDAASLIDADEILLESGFVKDPQNPTAEVNDPLAPGGLLREAVLVIDKVQGTATNPQVQNFATSAIPSTETSFALTGISRFTIVNRGKVIVRLSYGPTTDSVFFSLFPNAPYFEIEIGQPTVTFYVQAPLASQRLEVITWS